MSKHFGINHPLLGNQHHELRKKVRDFAETVVKPQAASLDEKAEFSVPLTREMGKLGLFKLHVPEKYGGLALDTLSYIIAVEELARIDSSQAATVAAHNSLGLSPFMLSGTEEQKASYLPRLVNGDQLWAFGVTETNAGSDTRGIETVATLENGHWVINGSKKYITNISSTLSSGITILAKTGEKNGKPELSSIIVDRETKGYSTQPIQDKMMWRAADTGQLTLENCRVPKSNLLGERGEGTKIMLKTIDGGRLSIAAMGLGLAQGAYEMAKSHAGNRVQFGRPLKDFQTISFKLSDMALKIELARNTLYKACWQKDQGLPFTRESAMAKLYCSEIAKEVSDEAIQIFGARGLMKDNDIERFYRDQRILQIGEGTTEILKLVISRNI